jgi:hypothetical protein
MHLSKLSKITDNTRVLRTYTAYSVVAEPWLQGYYIDIDGHLSIISTMLKKNDWRIK